MHEFDVHRDPVRRRSPKLPPDSGHVSGEVAALIRRLFAITQAAVSQHLKVLRDSGFASTRIDGPRRIYAVDTTPLKDVDAWLERFRRFWQPRLDALATEVARGKRRRR